MGHGSNDASGRRRSFALSKVRSDIPASCLLPSGQGAPFGSAVAITAAMMKPVGIGTANGDRRNLDIRRATHTELNVVVGILTESAIWQAAEREAVWPIPFPSATVEASMVRQETHVLCREDKVIGTVALSWDDPVWEVQPSDSGYVHRLAVSRRCKWQRSRCNDLDVG